METTTALHREPLRAADVMKRLGYKTRHRFWQFVKREGVPCIRLNGRNIIFDEQQLNDWIANRSTASASR